VELRTCANFQKGLGLRSIECGEKGDDANGCAPADWHGASRLSHLDATMRLTKAEGNQPQRSRDEECD
jgi:hypothetical protein